MGEDAHVTVGTKHLKRGNNVFYAFSEISENYLFGPLSILKFDVPEKVQKKRRVKMMEYES
jgi:hypothetical protein